MNKKDYEKPTMTVVELRHRTQLLAGSGVQSMRSGYGKANEDVTSTGELNGGGEWEWN